MTVMFRPTPSTITDTGYVACSCAPARNSGLRGPGTFEITRFTGGRGRPRVCIVVRAASAGAAGGGDAGAAGGRGGGGGLLGPLGPRLHPGGGPGAPARGGPPGGGG